MASKDTTEIIRKYSKLVHVMALSRTSQPSDADDVYQEVFLRYIDKQPNFRDEQHEKAWFIKVTINITRDMYKSAAHSKRADFDEAAAEDEMTDSEFIEQVEQRAVFSERIEQLPPRYRMVLLLHFDCGYTLREIAKMTGESEACVKSLLARAKKQYKELVMKGEEK